MNAEQEKWIIENFRDVYKDFPNGALEKKDPPSADYRLTLVNGKTIGIEITEALHSESSREISTVTKEFTNALIEALEPKMPFPFIIDIDLNEATGIPKSKRKEVIEKTVQFCLSEFTDLENNGDRGFNHIETNLTTTDPHIVSLIQGQGFRNLPPGISRIRMFRFDNIRKSFNSHVSTPFFRQCLS